MKKILSILLILVLLLGGCSTPTEEAYPDGSDLKFPHFGEGRTPPAGERDPDDIDGGITYTDYRFDPDEGRAALWNNIAFYENDPYDNDPWQPKVYRTAIGEGEKPELVFNGELIGVFGDALIVADNDYYYAVDLKKGKDWVRLNETGMTTASLEYKGKLLLFGNSNDQGYVDTVELKTLTATRKRLEAPVRQLLSEGDTLYCLMGGDLYRGNLADGTGEWLCKAYVYGSVDKAGQRIMIRRYNCDPIVYDLETGKSFKPKEFPPPFYQCCGRSPQLGSVRHGVAVIGYDREDGEHGVWYYDIASGKELTEAPAPQTVYTLTNGSYTQNEDGTFRFDIDGEQFTVRALPDGVVGKIYANCYGMFCYCAGNFFTVDREENSRHVLYYEVL